MTPIGSFSHLLNGIFSEFQADSTIVISYSLLTNDNAGQVKQIARLTGVNGFSNSDAYRDYLQSVKARLLSSIEDCLAGLDDRSRQQFLRLVMERCQRYALLTLYRGMVTTWQKTIIGTLAHIGFFIMQRSMPSTVTNPMREPAGISSGVHAALPLCGARQAGN